MSTTTYVQFAFATLLPALATILIWQLQHKTAFAKLSYGMQQAIIGVLFGIIAIFGTEFGIDTLGVIMNVRDAAPIVGGLLFGGPAGIIAGTIGGVERWFAVLWGRGMFTRVGCSIATFTVGVYAALLRKYILDDHRPTWLLGLFIGAVAEVWHLALIFVTNMSDAEHALLVVRTCTLPMVLSNAIAVMFAVMVWSWLEKAPAYLDPEHRPITQMVQMSMLMSVLVAYVVTTGLTFGLQSSLMDEQTSTLLALNIDDVADDLRHATEGDISGIARNRHVGEDGYVFVVNADGTVISGRSGIVGSTLEDMGMAVAMENCSNRELVETTYFGDSVYAMKDGFQDCQIIAIQPTSEAHSARNASVLVSSYAEVLIFASLFTVIYFLIKRLVVDDIRDVNETLDQITDGNLDAEVDVRTSREFASLSDNVNETVDALKQAIDEAAARIDAELEYARTIQRSALPRVFPPFPWHDDFQVYASMNAAKEVGGDFYDFYLLDDDHLVFLIADVSGKGIPASLFMMRAKTLIKSLALSRLDVNEVFTQANEDLCASNEAEMFVTCWMGVLDLTNGHVTFANAGHNPPALAHEGGTYAYHVTRPNLVLGGMDGIPYRAHEMDLEPGDTLFLYTDGVTEATDSAYELFGEDRLLASLDRCTGADVKSICKTVHADVDAFVAEAPQFDDITMVALRYVGRKADEDA